MSYDLMIFAPESAPQGNEAFMEWYEDQTEWAEEHSYNDPAVTTPALRAWFLEMIQSFPAMNGPFASDDESSVTDYSVGRAVIYAIFAWSKAEQAYQAMFRLAGKHGVGLFNASSDSSEVWLTDGKGGLSLAHSR